MTNVESQPQVHDFGPGNRRWGHDYTIHQVKSGGLRLEASGWGRDIKQGDYLLLQNKDRSTRYRVVEISYYRDPSDMWSATLDFSPRLADMA